jgi:D-aminopeptidase
MDAKNPPAPDLPTPHPAGPHAATPSGRPRARSLGIPFGGTPGADAPLLPGQCQALARRVTLGLARTGTTGSHFSDDLFLAFSTANPGAFSPYHPASPAAGPGPDPGPGYDQLRFVPWGRLDPFFAAVVHGTEEAVANALVANEDMVGRLGDRSPALPRDRVAELFRARRISGGRF